MTLIGAGGSGKTRLALEAISLLSPLFPLGVFLVELAPLSGTELVLETVAHTLNVKTDDEVTLLDSIAAFFGNGRALLVLDNCEHLLGECMTLASELLGACPDLHVLATSREPLGVGGECIFRVPLLSLPNPVDPDTMADPAGLNAFEAVELFVDRVRLVDNNFTLSHRNARAVAQVCIQLDGIPLALELAAAALRSITIGDLASRLDQRFKLLTSADRTTLPRQRTLEAMLDWSYMLLNEAEQSVFRRLAVFPGDWFLEAAEYIAADKDESEDERHAPAFYPAEVAEIVLHLVDKSLVQFDRAEGRYRMLETIRLYARRKSEAAGEWAVAAWRHCRWYLRFAESGAEHQRTSAQLSWFAMLEREHDNMRAALGWAIADGMIEEAARLALALYPFWMERAYHQEGVRWLQQIVALAPGAGLDAGLRVQLLNALGASATGIKRFSEATGFYHEALDLRRELDDRRGVIDSLLKLGWKSFEAAELSEAESQAKEGLALARQEGDKRLVAVALNLLVSTRIADDRLEGVQPAIEECLALWRELDDLPQLAATLSTYAQVERLLGNVERACALLLEGLHMQVSLGTYTGLLPSMVGLLQFTLTLGRAPEKYVYLARICGIVDKLEATMGGGRSPWSRKKQVPMYEELRAHLGDEGFTREFNLGLEMSIADIARLGEEIIAALRVHTASSELSSAALSSTPTSSSGASAARKLPDGLTAREVEVLRLVAAGLTNAQAAAELSVTPRTINAHLTSIYGKIGVTSRTQAVRYAVEHKLD